MANLLRATHGRPTADPAGDRAWLLRQLKSWSPALNAPIQNAGDEIIPRLIHALPVGHLWPRVPGAYAADMFSRSTVSPAMSAANLESFSEPDTLERVVALFRGLSVGKPT